MDPESALHAYRQREQGDRGYRCGGCIFWNGDPFVDATAECRLRPPDVRRDKRGQFPITSHADFCGEHIRIPQTYRQRRGGRTYA